MILRATIHQAAAEETAEDGKKSLAAALAWDLVACARGSMFRLASLREDLLNDKSVTLMAWYVVNATTTLSKFSLVVPCTPSLIGMLTGGMCRVA